MLILASRSPRRREILEMLGFEYLCKPADADESIPAGTSPDEAVKLLAYKKAAAVSCCENDVIIGSDTIVVMEGEILGKPADAAQAKTMLRRLSGKTHRVYTGVCIICGEATETFECHTDVTFYELSDAEIDAYVATGDPLDKAGAYGIQGIGAVNVKSIDGDFFTVMGLPAAETARRLRKFGVLPVQPKK